MKYFILTFLLMEWVQTLQGQQVSNVCFNQSGKQVSVTYDLDGDESLGYFITMFFSIDDGQWIGPLKSVSGNVGPGQRVGKGKQINWMVLDEVDKIEGDVGFMIQAGIVDCSDRSGRMKSKTDLISNSTLDDVNDSIRSDGKSGTFIDSRDGNIYNWVRIGTQIWMAENLAYLTKQNTMNEFLARPARISPPIVGSSVSPRYYVHNYEGGSVKDAKSTSNYSCYGVLYNWPAVLNGSHESNSVPSDVQGICPPGWHVPSHAEWTILTDYLGDNAWGKLKEAGNINWSYTNSNSNNESGFTARPGGYRNTDGGFSGLGFSALFWSSTEGTSTSAWGRGLECGGITSVQQGRYDRGNGFSVRCLKDH